MDREQKILATPGICQHLLTFFPGRHEEFPRAPQPGQPVLPFHQLGQDLVPRFRTGKKNNLCLTHVILDSVVWGHSFMTSRIFGQFLTY